MLRKKRGVSIRNAAHLGRVNRPATFVRHGLTYGFCVTISYATIDRCFGKPRQAWPDLRGWEAKMLGDNLSEPLGDRLVVACFVVNFVRITAVIV